MSDYTPPREAVGAASKVIAENSDEPGWSAVVIARDALTAAGPIIAAQALREAASAAVAEEEGVPWDHDHDRATVSAWLLGFAARVAQGERGGP